MAELCKEMFIETENKPGVLAKVTNAIKDSGVNIRALCAWGDGDKGHFMMVTEDNDKVIPALKKIGYEVAQTEVILIELINQTGQLCEVADQLGQAGINVKYSYISASGPTCLAVIGTDDNAKAIEVL